MLSFQDFSCRPHIVNPSIGAGADHYLINGYLLSDLINRLCVFRQMRKCNGRPELAQINGILFLIYGIFIRFIDRKFPVRVFLHIGNSKIIHRENSIFPPCFNGHVGNRKPVIHGQVFNPFSCKFHGLIQGAVYADHSDNMKDNILSADPFARLSYQVKFYGRGHLKPRFTGCHPSCHIRTSHSC